MDYDNKQHRVIKLIPSRRQCDAGALRYRGGDCDALPGILTYLIKL
jgi:hypothetical protein